MFAYCGNNPVSRQDCAGTLWETLLGAAIGGGLAGALVGAVSHLVNCGINGDEVTVSGLLGAAANGAVLGALGAVSGVVEGAALAGSAIVGIVTGVSAIMNTEGSAGEKLLSGLSSGFLAGMGTYLGTKMPIAQGDILSSAVSAFAGGLMLGAQTETCVVLAQQAVGAIGKGNSPAPSSGTHRQISTVAAY